MEQQIRRAAEQQQARKPWEKPALTVLVFKETATFGGFTPEAPTIDRS